MKQPIYLHIPEPCNEDWNKMSATQQGRYCESCCKQVIDFSMMTDQEILKHITKASSKICGRFTEDQLQRPLTETKIENKKGWKWLMASVISLVMTNRTEAQQKRVTTKQKTTYTEVMKGDIIMSPVIDGIVIASPPKTNTIKHPTAIVVRGIVQNSEGVLLPGTTISSGDHVICNTNDKGEFSFTRDFSEFHNILSLTFSFVGHEDFPVITVLGEDTINLQIRLKIAPKLLDEVVVKANNMVVGALRRYYAVSTKDTLPVADTLVTILNKVFNTEPFKVYPNPATKGSQVHVQIKEAGSYVIQLLDNQSRLLSIKETTIANKDETVQLSLSYTLPSACYYVRVMNTNTGKQFVSKLLVQ